METRLAVLRALEQSLLASLHSVVYPILTLPNEITTAIFIRRSQKGCEHWGRMGQGTLLPHLEEFYVDKLSNAISIRSIVRMLSARAHPANGVARITSFRCNHRPAHDFWLWDDLKEDGEEALCKLRELRSQGMAVEIGWGPSWFRELTEIGSAKNTTRLQLARDSYWF
ncbi:hypothetical protein FB45DRAFT_1029366 [Roridomyces roridus]|uniref:Uncharacterized protein n=1 Tax=Roridomyces roridus TaxID=1738132 RepID=A0AAD7BPW4_9AGAR|nr:hypothetical protein FB45DRAFT_1029366 [Roridomyces roridus]